MKPLKIGLLNFECSVLRSELPVLLVFGAVWDADSRQLYSQLERIGEKYDGKLITGIVDYDYVPDIFSEYEVYDIPTAMIIEDGREFKRRFGYKGLKTLENFLNYFFGVLPY